MVLQLRQRQSECMIKMLTLNQEPGEQPSNKILICDSYTQKIVSVLLSPKDLKKYGVTQQLLIEKNPRPIKDVSIIYFIRPLIRNMYRVICDASLPHDNPTHVHILAPVPPPFSDKFNNVPDLRLQVHDLEFIALEEPLFTLGMRESYLRINCHRIKEADANNLSEEIVRGLFSVLRTRGVVPVIRCPKGSFAEYVAEVLDRRIRDNAHLFAGRDCERPVLYLSDRSLEFRGGILHDPNLRYCPLVNEVFGLNLNRVKVEGESGLKTYEVNESDSFWAETGYLEFHRVVMKVAGNYREFQEESKEVEDLLNAVNTMTVVVREVMSCVEDTMMSSRLLNEELDESSACREDDGPCNNSLDEVTRRINRVNLSLAEMAGRKKLVAKHKDILRVLLREIQERSLITYATLEKILMKQRAVDEGEIIRVLRRDGSETDKLRLALIYLMAGKGADVFEVEALLRDINVDTYPLLCMINMKIIRSNDSNLTLCDKVEALMGGNLSVDSCRVFDPLVPKCEVGGRLYGKFEEAIVFVMGGGNYLEYGDLQEWARSQQPPKHVVYGSTEIFNAEEFIRQLSIMGQMLDYDVRSLQCGEAEYT